MQVYEYGNDSVAVENVVGVKATEKALLVRLEDGSEHWIPNSQITDESEVYGDSGDSNEGLLVITKWIAKQKGLYE